MHVPDGVLDATTSIATGAVAAGAVGLSLHRADREIRESGPALAGLTSVFVFAVQMVNFPVDRRRMPVRRPARPRRSTPRTAALRPWVPRSVLMDDGRIGADGATRDVLADAELMAVHRLELPYGFDPLSVPGAAVRAQR